MLMDLKAKIKALSEQYFTEVVSWRAHLHAHPELAFEEYQTSEFICKKLDEIGIPYEKGIAKTGIIGLIKGKNPEKKVFALRADMDALPIQETNNVPYKSQNEGIMHACGHDVHTSCVLGSAKILNELKDELEGTIKLIFQPSEEKLPGGASVMIKEGALENPKVDHIIGQHVYPELEAGKVGFRPGVYMASCDELHVTIKGKGGHAALPQNVVNPLMIASKMLLEIDHTIKEQKGEAPTVLSFGKIMGNGATNVVPDVVKIEGTFRTLDETWRAAAHKIMKKTAIQIASEMGGDCDFDIHLGYPFLKNNEPLTHKMQDLAKDYLGSNNVIDLDIRMTAEDFSYYSQVVDACFYRLGVRNESLGITSSVHTSTFDIDIESLKVGMGLMAWLAINQ